MTDPALIPATELAAAYGHGTLSPVEVAQAAFARLDRFEPEVSAFVLVQREGALAQARASEARWREGRPLGLLDGVPVTVKDNIAEAGLPNRKGSRLSDPAPAPENAPAVARLREAGSVILGRTALPEFGWIGHCSGPTGVTRNSWDLGRTPGGSSGGAVVAAALGIGALHLGTDAAGSVRILAAFTGVFALKPTYGRVPAYPPSPFAMLAHLGPLTRGVEDAALMLGAIARPDARDIFALNLPAPDYCAGLDEGVRGLRFAWSPRLGYAEDLDPEIEAITGEAARVFEALGAVVEEADPGLPDPIDLLAPLWFAGAAAALAPIPPERRGEMDPGLVACAEAGRRVSGADVLSAITGRASVSLGMYRFHERHDLLLTPTMPLPAVEAGRDVPAGWRGRGGPLAWTGWSPYTYPFNLTGQPAASVPCGFTRAGLPAGLQIVGPMRRDNLVLRAARAFERARPFRMADGIVRGAPS